RGQVQLARKAAPEMGRLLGRGVAVTDGVGVAPPVGVLAVTVLAEMTPLALAAGDVVLHEHQVALLEALAPGEFAARLGDGADVLVAHDHRSLRRRGLVDLDLGSPAAAPHSTARALFSKAASPGTSGIVYSRISVFLGPCLAVASSPSATEKPPLDRCRAQSRTDPRAVKRDFHAGCVGRVRVLLMKSRSVREPARRSQRLGRPRCCGPSTSVPNICRPSTG